MKKKGAIFDLDGTLIDSMKVWENADHIIADRYGFVPDNEYLSFVTTRSFLEGADYITTRYNLRKTKWEIMDELYEIALNDYKNNIILKPGVKELLKKFSSDGMKMGIATSNMEEMTHEVLKSNGIFEYFEAFAYCDEVGKNKAFPDVYNLAAKGLGLSASDCYIFEDIPYAVKGAKLSGAEVIGVYDIYSAEKEDELRKAAHRFIMSFEDFIY